MSSQWTHYRGKVAGLSRTREPDDPELLDARQAMRAARIADYVKGEVAKFPPLTAEQRERIALILIGGGAR